MTTLMKASNEWSTRPDDQKFPSLEALHGMVSQAHQRAAFATVPWAGLGTSGRKDALCLTIAGAPETPRLTRWAMSQLAARAGAPMSYLATLSPALASECLTYGLVQAQGQEREACVLFDDGGGTDYTTRGILSPAYARIWNEDITSRLLRLKSEQGWAEAPAAFDGSRGMYGSDQDMFAFMVDNSRRIFETLPGGGLSRGFFAWNSEVGASSFGVMTFLYEYVCGNHRVWGATNVQELRIRHIGEANDRAFAALGAELKSYADASEAEDVSRIEALRTYRLGATKEEALDRVFGLRGNEVPRKVIEASILKAIEGEARYGDPFSAWGITGGMTEIARDLPNASERVLLERGAKKLMDIVLK